MRNILRRTYFWIYGKTNMGKPVVMGPYSEQLKADMISEKLDDSKVFPLKTRNIQQATRSIKASLVQSSSGSVDEHIRPHQHSLGGEKSFTVEDSFPYAQRNNSLANEILESSN